MFSQISSYQLPLRSRRGGVTTLLVFGLLSVVLFGAVAAYFYNNRDESELIAPIMTLVSRGEFVSQVLDQGEIQSSENVEIRCEAKARNGILTVLKVVPEGTRVKEGDFLVQLDTTAFEIELDAQKVIMAASETAKIQAEATLSIALASLEEYNKGTFVEAEKTIQNEIYDAESAIQTANQELKQAEAVYEHSKKLHAKAYITQQALEATEFAVQRANIGVEKGQNLSALANKKLEVLRNITSVKFVVQFESDIKAAKVNLSSQNDAFLVEQSKLAEIQAQMKLCTITVPKGVSGQVVYSKESSRGGEDWGLEEGGTVRENQVLIRLPNPNKMEVKALINEQSITQIEVNMPASIRVDALNNVSLKGIVTKVNQYAEQSGWMTSSIRKYAVFVRIINPPDSLKPGMNASVGIQTQYASDALLAPIQSVYGVQERQFCLAKVGENQWKTLEVETGGDNSQMVMFKSGVEEGTQLVMNPAAYKEYMDLPEMKLDTKIELSDDELGSARPRGDSVPVAPSTTNLADAASPPTIQNAAGQRPPRGGSADRPGGRGNRPIPASGLALIQSKDTDADGKLSKDEAGADYSPVFDRIDADSDGFLSQAEADVSIKRMKERMQSGGGPGGGGPGGPGGPGGGGPARGESGGVSYSSEAGATEGANGQN